MNWKNSDSSPSQGLKLIYGQRKDQISKVLQEYLQIENMFSIVIDVNHNWSAENLSSHTRLFQPNDKNELFKTLNSLNLYLSPQLNLIIVDSLPTFFRDYYPSSDFSTQNMRSYAASLAILRKISSAIHIIVTSFTHGISKTKPFMPKISKYYCDEIVHINKSRLRKYVS